jgi:hypothetical protein
VQEELQHDHAVPAQVTLEPADVRVAILEDLLRLRLDGQPLALEELGMHADHQHLLVVRAVEDADAAALGEALRAAPEKVVVELFVARRLEGGDLASLRIHSRHHVLDRAVLPGGVHGLEDHEHRPAVLGVEHVLELGERLDAHGQDLLGPDLLVRAEAQGVPRVHVLEAERLAFADSKRS